MKIFISHQQADSVLASRLANRLKSIHGVASYLDVIDPDLGKSNDALADHVKDELGKCTQLLAVVSAATQKSWWVPWEIGIATEKEFPLATYSGSGDALPEYLRKWPYLRSDEDLDIYARVSRTTQQGFETRKGYLTEAVARVRSTKEFYSTLRTSLRQ